MISRLTSTACVALLGCILAMPLSPAQAQAQRDITAVNEDILREAAKCGVQKITQREEGKTSYIVHSHTITTTINSFGAWFKVMEDFKTSTLNESTRKRFEAFSKVVSSWTGYRELSDDVKVQGHKVLLTCRKGDCFDYEETYKDEFLNKEWGTKQKVSSQEYSFCTAAGARKAAAAFKTLIQRQIDSR